MHVWSHDRATFPLPAGHRFPLAKYRLLRERLQAQGGVEVHEPDPIAWADLARVHDRPWLERVRLGRLTRREERGLGLPWSPQLVARARRATAGTVAAAGHALEAGVALNLGGGTHHAGPDWGRGFCLLNDVAVATAAWRTAAEVRRVLVLDCDVHQGDGTAALLGPDRDAFTVSLHGARNFPFTRIPSDLDIDLPSGTGDDEYLRALDAALDRALAEPAYDLAFFLAGADPWSGDRLGRLSLSKAGLRARDEAVIGRLRAAGVPVCVVLAGGYAEDVRDTVDINAATAAVVAAHTRAGDPAADGDDTAPAVP